MSVRGLYRGATPIGSATATNAPIYVDSDDNQLKVLPNGAGTTSERIVQTAGGSVATAAATLTTVDYGKTFFLNSATEFQLVLPAALIGAKLSFIVTAAPSGASYTIITPASAEILFGKILSAAGDAGDVENTGGGTTITFADGQAVVGDRVDLVSDGTNWYVVGYASVAAGITITG